MSLRRRRQTGEPEARGTIAVSELVQHGLSRRPGAVGIYWPEAEMTVCKAHIERPHVRQVLGATRLPTDRATVLVGGEVAPRACALLHDR